MQQSSWEANSHSAIQETPRLFVEPEGSLPRSQEHATGPYFEPDESSPQPATREHGTYEGVSKSFRTGRL
jgi:hypothetical protein